MISNWGILVHVLDKQSAEVSWLGAEAQLL